MKRDMVEGSIARAMVAFTVPLMLSGILQQLFNWVDAFIVGNVEGELALAGIGATTALYSLFVMVITGFTGGLSVLAARAYGMGEQGGLGRLLSAFSLLLGSVFTAVAALGLLLTPAILRAMDTPADIFTVSERYLRIMFAGVPLLAVYNTYSAILRGMGNSRAPFLSVLVCSGVNVVLDVAFVVMLRYGAAGGGHRHRPLPGGDDRLSGAVRREKVPRAALPAGPEECGPVCGRQRQRVRSAAGHPVRDKLGGKYFPPAVYERLWGADGGRHHYRLPGGHCPAAARD